MSGSPKAAVACRAREEADSLRGANKLEQTPVAAKPVVVKPVVVKPVVVKPVVVNPVVVNPVVVNPASPRLLPGWMICWI